jgi:hypothetical protein
MNKMLRIEKKTQFWDNYDIMCRKCILRQKQMIDDTKDITVRGCDTGLLFLIWDDVFIIVINIKVDY